MLAVVTLVTSVVNIVATHTLSALLCICIVELTMLCTLWTYSLLYFAKAKFFYLSVWFLLVITQEVEKNKELIRGASQNT